VAEKDGVERRKSAAYREMLESDDQIDTETCRTTPHILENGTECKSFTPLTDSAPCRQVPDGRVTGALTTWMAGFAPFAYRHRYIPFLLVSLELASTPMMLFRPGLNTVHACAALRSAHP
jgi:hypothetical protein